MCQDAISDHGESGEPPEIGAKSQSGSGSKQKHPSGRSSSKIGSVYWPRPLARGQRICQIRQHHGSSSL